MKQADLARIMHAGKSTISQYANDERRPDADTLIQLAELFGVRIDWLLGRSPIRGNESYLRELPESVRVALRTLNDLSPKAQEQALSYIRYLLNEEERGDKK